LREVIGAARQRKTKQIEHKRTLWELALERAGVDLEDFDPEYQPAEYHLNL